MKTPKIPKGWSDAKTGALIELPESGAGGLNPSVKRGDQIRTLCRIEQGGGWLCGPYTVIYFCGSKPVYRPRYAKVDKVAAEWVVWSKPIRRRKQKG